jgi:hypothetical protein
MARRTIRGIQYNKGREVMAAALVCASTISKLHIFLRRVAHQSIPTGDVRHHRQMEKTRSCSICGEKYSLRHSLLNCTVAHYVFALANEEMVEHIRTERPICQTMDVPHDLDCSP